MYFYRKKICKDVTRDLFYFNNNLRSRKINKKILKRFYHVSTIKAIKFKFFFAKKFLSKTIFNYLKPNVQNKLSSKQEKVLKHYGNEIDGKFITVDNKVKFGFSTITSKNQYTLNTVDGEERIEPLPCGNGNFMSQEILLVNDKYIDKNELNLNVQNTSIDEISIQNSQDNINHFVEVLNLDNKQMAQIYTRDLLDNDSIRKGY